MTDNFDVDAALASGDPDLMDKALEVMTASEQDESNAADEQAQPEAEAAEESASSGGQAEEQPGQQEAEAEKVIIGKSGKHEIPYSVLEAERAKAQQLEQQLEQQRQQFEQLQQQYSNNESALNNVKSRLEAQGMDTEELFADPDAITEKQWAEIEEDYGVLGKAVRNLLQNQANIAERQAATPEPQTASAEPVNPVLQAINNNSDLSDWQKNDPDRWTHAVQMDEALKVDPQWKDKSFDERFAEAARRTKSAFGDDLRAKAKNVIDKTQQSAPSSLTDVGHAPTSDKSLHERLNGISEDQLLAEMDRLTDAQVDEVLSAGF